MAEEAVAEVDIQAIQQVLEVQAEAVTVHFHLQEQQEPQILAAEEAGVVILEVIRQAEQEAQA
jgi:hypothetical protein